MLHSPAMRPSTPTAEVTDFLDGNNCSASRAKRKKRKGKRKGAGGPLTFSLLPFSFLRPTIRIPRPVFVHLLRKSGIKIDVQRIRKSHKHKDRVGDLTANIAGVLAFLRLLAAVVVHQGSRELADFLGEARKHRQGLEIAFFEL